MRRTGEEVAPYIRRQSDIPLGVCAHKVRRLAQVPEFERPEGLHDLRTGVRGAAAVEQPSGRTMSRAVLIIGPPQNAVAAGFIHARGTTSHRETEIHCKLP